MVALVTGILYHTKMWNAKKTTRTLFFLARRFLVQLLYGTSQKWAIIAKVHKIDTLLPIRQATSILFCNLISHICRIILHKTAFLISFVRTSSTRLVFFWKYLDNHNIFERFYSKLILQWRNFCSGTTKPTRWYNINFRGAKFLYTKLKRVIWVKPLSKLFKKSPVSVWNLLYETAVLI